MTLSCPEGENYAAIAKQLHLTALQAEERIYTLEQQLRAAANRSTLIQTSTAVVNIPAGLTAVNYFFARGGSPTVINFNNTDSGVIGIDDAQIFSFLGAGVYEIGVYASGVSSGAITDNSQRVWRITQERVDPTLALGFTVVHEASIIQFETNTGVGTDVCISGTFKIQATDRIGFTLNHDNATSVNVSVGTVAWLHRLSDATVLAVI